MLMATLELWDIELGDYVVGHMIRKLICDNDSGAQELSIDAGQYVRGGRICTSTIWEHDGNGVPLHR
jgi:hypothetical protein